MLSGVLQQVLSTFSNTPICRAPVWYLVFFILFEQKGTPRWRWKVKRIKKIQTTSEDFAWNHISLSLCAWHFLYFLLLFTILEDPDSTIWEWNGNKFLVWSFSLHPTGHQSGGGASRTRRTAKDSWPGLVEPVESVKPVKLKWLYHGLALAQFICIPIIKKKVVGLIKTRCSLGGKPNDCH